MAEFGPFECYREPEKAAERIAALVKAIRDYLATFDRCGGSESVSAEEFAERRQRMRDLVGQMKDR